MSAPSDKRLPRAVLAQVRKATQPSRPVQSKAGAKVASERGPKSPRAKIVAALRKLHPMD